MSYLIGIDLGTSSVKVALVRSTDFKVIQTGAAEYRINHPQPQFAEQDPEAWWQATITAVQQAIINIDPTTILGIGLDGQMHGLVCLGKDGWPVYPAIIWADTRSKAEVAELHAHRQAFSSVMPGPPSAGFAAASLRWLSKHRPEILKQTAVALLPKDYLRYRLTAEIGTEPSDATSTWLFDIKTGGWSQEVAEFCGISLDQLPPIFPSAEVAGGLTQSAAQVLGLSRKTPVVYGAADLPAQALGHGVITPGDLLVTVGTGGQVLTPLAKPQLSLDQVHYTFCHCSPDVWYAQAAMLTAGLSLRWLRDLLGMTHSEDAFDRLSSMAQEVPAGAEGLLFLPYLAGERTPHADPQAAGLFLGLRLHHQAKHMARAVMEGVCFGLKDCLELVRAADDRPIVLSGGIAKSAVWSQMAADIWQRPLSIISGGGAPACVGGAMLAAVGIGLYVDLEAAKSALSFDSTIIMPQQHAIYPQRYAQYQRLYSTLRNEMHLLTQHS